MNPQPYDFIFAGGGLAGLSLAYHLAHSPLGDSSMLIVDRDPKNRNDHTWCYWTKEATPFDSIAQCEWNRIRFVSDQFDKAIDLGDYKYKLIRGIDFYRFVRQELAAHSNIAFLQGIVETIEDDADCAHVRVNGQTRTARWVFDSRFDWKTCNPDPAHCHSLRQYFVGWEIETTDDAFDPETPTLMDFRTPQKQMMRFFYILPFSKRRALVEYVTQANDNCTDAMKTYIMDVLKIQNYRVIATEGGVNPMTDYAFSRHAGRQIFDIGTRGGRIKPSTGYAFLRIQQDSAAIVQSLIEQGHPFNIPADSRRYRFFDMLMLDVMQRHGGEIKPIFTALFKNNPIERVLRLLDEQGSLIENVQLIASLPPKLFLEAILRTLKFSRISEDSKELAGTEREIR